MAYIKIFPIKVTVGKAVDYICNPDKTDESILISSFGCSPETADLEFSMTRETGKRNVMDKEGNLAWHLIQSFKPGEVTPEKAHELGKQFADSVLKGKYEYVISTHIDKNHVHNHIVFNTCSFVDYHKYKSDRRNIYRLCRLSNRICQENGLDVSVPSGDKGRSYKENMEYHSGKSWKAQLKAAIDKAIRASVSYEEFLMKMKLTGYEVREGKYLAFRAPEQINFTNTKTLGSYYTEKSIFSRLAQNRTRLKIPQKLTREIRAYADITLYVTDKNRAGYERWAKLNNLKEAAKTFNYLCENKLLNYEDFQKHITDMDGSVAAAHDKIDEIGHQIQTKQLIKKHCSAYRASREIIENEKSTLDPALYRGQHHKEYELHAASKQALKKLGVKALPKPEKLDAQIEKLEAEQAAARDEWKKLRKQQDTLNIVIRNFEQLLNNDNVHLQPERTQEQLTSAPDIS